MTDRSFATRDIEDHSEAVGRVKIVRAALEAFAELGYAGSSIREIARRADLSLSALYSHFPSKKSILTMLINDLMDELISETREAIRAAESPTAQLEAGVRTYINAHTRRQKECFVANSELRSLREEEREWYLGKRRAQQDMFEGVVQRGVQEGFFKTPYPRDATRAILALCRSVSEWYNPVGSLTSDEVGRRYSVLALDMLRSPRSFAVTANDPSE